MADRFQKIRVTNYPGPVKFNTFSGLCGTPYCITHIMPISLPLQPVCQCVFYTNVRDDFMCTKSLK